MTAYLQKDEQIASRQRITHAVGWLGFWGNSVDLIERILFDAVAGDVGDGELTAVFGEGEDAPEGFVAFLVPLELDGPGRVAAGGLDDVEAAAVGHVVGVGHAAVGGEAEGGAVALPGAEKGHVGVGVLGLVEAEIVDPGAVGEGYGAVAEAQAGVVGPGLAVAGDGDEQIGQHVTDVAGQDDGYTLALVEGLPGLALLAALVDAPGLDGDLGPVVAGDDAIRFIALIGHGLALGEVFQEGVLFPIAALFENAGYMHKGKIYTAKVIELEEGSIHLGKILQKNVDEKYYIPVDKKAKWVYLKGAKKIPRTSASGHEYVFSEGPVAFPDPWDRPGRTMLTSESTLNRSTHDGIQDLWPL